VSDAGGEVGRRGAEIPGFHVTPASFWRERAIRGQRQGRWAEALEAVDTARSLRSEGDEDVGYDVELALIALAAALGARDRARAEREIADLVAKSPPERGAWRQRAREVIAEARGEPDLAADLVAMLGTVAGDGGGRQGVGEVDAFERGAGMGGSAGEVPENPFEARRAVRLGAGGVPFAGLPEIVAAAGGEHEAAGERARGEAPSHPPAPAAMPVAPAPAVVAPLPGAGGGLPAAADATRWGRPEEDARVRVEDPGETSPDRLAAAFAEASLETLNAGDVTDQEVENGFDVGVTLMSMGRWELALRQFNHVGGVGRLQMPVMEAALQCYVELERHSEALHESNVAIRFVGRGRAAGMWYYRGKAAQALGMAEIAREAYQHVVDGAGATPQGMDAAAQLRVLE
jgi:tetratricopeptide (TPR) repeat protein